MKYAIIGLFLAIVLLAGCTGTQTGKAVSPEPNVSKLAEQPAQNPVKNTSVVKNTTPTVDSDVVKVGDTVQVQYVGYLMNGKIFDTSYKDVAAEAGLPSKQVDTPLAFKIGEHKMIAGFENGVIGMKAGESKNITILPEDAYGQVDPTLQKWYSNDEFLANNYTPEVGDNLFDPVLGRQGVVLANNGTHTYIDFNHFLAGQTLMFTVDLVKIY